MGVERGIYLVRKDAVIVENIGGDRMEIAIKKAEPVRALPVGEMKISWED